MTSIEYFAVIDDEGRRGPFATMGEAAAVLEAASKQRGHTQEQARQFLLYGSTIVKVETRNGEAVFFNLGRLAPEKSPREESPAESTDALPEIIMAKATLRRKRK